MKLRLHPIVIVAIYMLTQTAFELSTEFATVGAENLRSYDNVQWFILAVKVAAACGITLKAYIDPSCHNYSNGKPPEEKQP
jgi:hypothetical protein